MLKALFKKQMMEVNAWLIQDKKKGEQRSPRGMILLVLFYIVIFVVLGSVFFFMGTMLCEPLVALDLGWLYFAMMGLAAVLLGVFGSVFNTYATLYRAKDNALLLSMPIPPFYILMVRLFGVWMWGLIYEAIVFVPTLLVYWITIPMGGIMQGVQIIVTGLILMLLLSVFVLALTCVFGWIVAKISVKLRNKSIVTVLASLLFLAVYYYVYFRAYELLQLILANAQAMGEKIRGIGYPIYLIGRAGEGSLIALLLTALMVVVLFALTWFVLSCSFLKIATANQGIARKQYRETFAKKRSIGSALLAKERGRFLSSATYMLNCGMGTLFLIIIAVLVMIKGASMKTMLMEMGVEESLLAMLTCAMLCMMTSMNDITAPSISLEGKNLWLLQSLPVSSWEVLKAKLKLHLILTEIPALLCAICVVVVLRFNWYFSASLLILPSLFILLSACFGLAINLKTPNLTWKDETIPVKQSIGVMASLLGGWVLVVAMGGLYFLMRNVLTPEIYLLCSACVIAVISVNLLLWLKNRGTQLFEAL
ncbi:MAG: hypothetical protein ACI4C1_08705 [Lachnospiraceae bacterium]